MAGHCLRQGAPGLDALQRLPEQTACDAGIRLSAKLLEPTGTHCQITAIVLVA